MSRCNKKVDREFLDTPKHYVLLQNPVSLQIVFSILYRLVRLFDFWNHIDKRRISLQRNSPLVSFSRLFCFTRVYLSNFSLYLFFFVSFPRPFRSKSSVCIWHSKVTFDFSKSKESTYTVKCKYLVKFEVSDSEVCKTKNPEISPWHKNTRESWILRSRFLNFKKQPKYLQIRFVICRSDLSIVGKYTPRRVFHEVHTKYRNSSRQKATRVIFSRKGHEIRFPSRPSFDEMKTHDWLLFLEPFLVFQDKTFREELRYFVLECSIYRFCQQHGEYSMPANRHRKGR